MNTLQKLAALQATIAQVYNAGQKLSDDQFHHIQKAIYELMDIYVRARKGEGTA